MRRCANSGQVFILAILTITLVLLSMQAYVYETTSQVISSRSDSFSDFVYMAKFGCRNTVIHSLANISAGGSISLLSDNLETFNSIIGTQYQFGKSFLDCTLKNTMPYSKGVWLSWGLTGKGFSGIYANFTFKVSVLEVNATVPFATNVTSTVSIVGSYQEMAGDNKSITIQCDLFNEGESALAKNITVYYLVGSNWQIANAFNSYLVTNYGNGTYMLQFWAEIPGNSVQVSTHVYDERDIFIQANVTCSKV